MSDTVSVRTVAVMKLAAVRRQVAIGGQVLQLQGLGGVYSDVYLPLHGEHQAHNAAVALAATGRLLTPMVPLLLELGVGVGDLESLIRRLYVESAAQDASRTPTQGPKRAPSRSAAEKPPSGWRHRLSSTSTKPASASISSSGAWRRWSKSTRRPPALLLRLSRACFGTTGATGKFRSLRPER